MRRLALLCLLVAVLAAACQGSGGSPEASSAGPLSPSPSSTPPPASASASPSVGPSPLPAVLPPGIPDAFGDDVAGRDLPVDELIPAGDEVIGVARTRGGPVEAVVITFATPGPDPFRQARGFVVWRRDPGADPPWRAVYGVAHGRRDGVFAISADTTDLTGDGSADALVREETGGSGQCATYRVVDLAAGSPIWRRGICDAEIQPSPDPIGLYEVARIYEPDDAHCCPSAIRERVLTWNGDRFVVVSQETTEI